MQIKFICNSDNCKVKGISVKDTLICPVCDGDLVPVFTGLNQIVLHGIKNLPVHISLPLFNIYSSQYYFKRLHLISDVLLGALRLYGNVIMAMSEKHNFLDESDESICETLHSKETHGLWSTFISNTLKKLDQAESNFFPSEIFTAFGVNAKNIRHPKIKRFTVLNTVVDSKGRPQQIKVVNTPVELLINYRNRYVGHGTVYSEKESEEIFKLYEPILFELISSISKVNIEFYDLKNQIALKGYGAICSGSICAQVNNRELVIPHNDQLIVYKRKPSLRRKYRCSNINCLVNEQEVQLPAAGSCLYCGNDLIPEINQSMDPDNKIITSSYPYFIAYPFQRALNESDGFKRIHLLKETFLNYLKYLGLITASEYFNSNLKLDEINRAFKKFLYRPQFGHWNAFMRSAVAELNEHEHRWFVKELPAYYFDIETKPYAELGETDIGRLIKFRNQYIGHGTVPSEDKCDQLWQEYHTVLKRLLLKMRFCRDYTIISSDKTISWRLMGEIVQQVNLRKELKANVALLNSNGEEMSLVPFFILPGEYFIKEVAERAQLMVYEQNTGSRIIFFSPESVHGETNNKKLLEELNLLIREKEKREPLQLEELDVDLWKTLLKENNRSSIQSLISERKVIKGVYQERQNSEDVLRSWLGSSAGLFFLAAAAGSGKTNLLIEMSRQYEELGIDSLILRGNRFRTSDVWGEIKYRLNLADDFDFGKSDFLYYSREKPLIILIDGVNEYTDSDELLSSAIKFLESNSGGHIKIIISWRVNTKAELPILEEKYIDLVYDADNEKDNGGHLIARSCHWLKPLNKVEVEGAWQKYAAGKKDKVKRKPNFSYIQLTYHYKALSDQLDNPLLLRLFLEIYNAKELPKRRDGLVSIWGLYHERLVGPQSSMTDNHLLLYRLAELMLKQQQYILSVDALFEDEKIGDFVKSIQIDSPYQQMILEGVLTEFVRDEKLWVNFTMEGYFHFVLGEVIYENLGKEGFDYLVNLLEKNRLNGVREGIEQCLFRDINHRNLDNIVRLMVLESEISTLVQYPLAHAFMKMDIQHVFNSFITVSGLNKWVVLRSVRNLLLRNQKGETVNELDSILKESHRLKEDLNNLITSEKISNLNLALSLISFYSDINALDQAKKYYSNIIKLADKKGLDNLVADALEYLAESEYKRAGKEGYINSLDALKRALGIRLNDPLQDPRKLKRIYRLLGQAYLSLGLQVKESRRYFEKCKEIIVEELSESRELADINLYIGLVSFWQGLRGIGRWGNPDPSLLEGVEQNLFDFADAQFQNAFQFYLKKLGKSHPKTLKSLHYLQENRYALGNYAKAIPWLKRYVDVLPFKSREHTDNFYYYCLIVSLEERAKELAFISKDEAIRNLEEAIVYSKGYDEDNLITNRLVVLKDQIIKGEFSKNEQSIEKLEDLTPLQKDKTRKAVFEKWELSDKLEGFTTNSWLYDQHGLWFYNNDKKQLAYWKYSSKDLIFFKPASWPSECSRIVLDSNNSYFYAWSSIKSSVFVLISADEKWERLSYGVHDVHACGASFGFDSINNRLFEFGGYGYFSYKNWLWVFDPNSRKWIQEKENKPGVTPYPRNGQMVPIENGEKVLLVSGIGNDTGIQREHKARMGLPSATDVGYFTWLRDAHVLDLRTMKWETILPPNNDTIRHEGAFGYNSWLNIVLNFGGVIPSPSHGEEPEKINKMCFWEFNSKNGFKEMDFLVKCELELNGFFCDIKNSSDMLYVSNGEYFILRFL